MAVGDLPRISLRPLERDLLELGVRHDGVDGAHLEARWASYSRARKKTSRANFWPTWRAKYALP